MVEIYSVCGNWKLNDKLHWEFLVDIGKGGSLCDVDENVSYLDLVHNIIEDFGIDSSVESRDVMLSYALPLRMKSMVEDSPPIYIRNDRQVRTFMNKIKGDGDMIRLCVTVSDKGNTAETIHNVDSVNGNIQPKTLHNVEITQWANVRNLDADSYLNESDEIQQELHESNESDLPVLVVHNDSSPTTLANGALDPSPISIRCSNYTGGDGIHVNKYFKNKEELMLKMRKWALEWNFQFKSLWSDKSRLVLTCLDEKCTWRMRATKLHSSDFFVVKKYVHEHTCDETKRTPNNKQVTAKLIGSLIRNNFGESNDGVKPKQIIEQVRREHGVEISYTKARRAKELAQKLNLEGPDSETELLCVPLAIEEGPAEKKMKSGREFGEGDSKTVRSHKCSVCGQEGHNKSTCKEST